MSTRIARKETGKDTAQRAMLEASKLLEKNADCDTFLRVMFKTRRELKYLMQACADYQTLTNSFSRVGLHANNSWKMERHIEKIKGWAVAAVEKMEIELAAKKKCKSNAKEKSYKIARV